MKLFCFPYAGGSSSSIYGCWNNLLNNIEVIPIELAGRGSRLGESYYSTFDDAIKDVQKMMLDRLEPNSPYMIFGHSMGALMAYELSYRMSEEGRNIPVHLFISGKSAPSVKKQKSTLYKLDDDSFKRELFELGGTPKEILEDDDLFELFAPAIRSDFKIVQTYNQSSKPILNIPVTVFCGTKDKQVNISEAKLWAEFTTKTCDQHFFNGGHFFIHKYKEQILSIVTSKVSS